MCARAEDTTQLVPDAINYFLCVIKVYDFKTTKMSLTLEMDEISEISKISKIVTDKSPIF